MIIVERFSVSVITYHMSKPYTLADRTMSMTCMDFKNGVLCKYEWNRCYFIEITIIYLLCWIKCRRNFIRMQSLYTRYETHLCSLCIRCKATLSLCNNTNTPEIVLKNKFILCLSPLPPIPTVPTPMPFKTLKVRIFAN